MSEPNILGEIIRGYSKLSSKGRTFFFKHPSVSDRLNIGEYESYLKERGREIGLLDKDQLLSRALSLGAWTKDYDDSLNSIQWTVDKKRESIKTLSDPSLKSSMQLSLERDEKELDELLNKKHKIQSPSLEDYVSLKLPYLLNRREVFFNENMTEQIDEETSKEIISLYAEKNSELLNRKNLLISAYSPNFFDLFFIYTSVDNIFNRNIYNLSIFQKELLAYGRILHSKLTNIQKIPDAVKNDPLKLYLFEEKMTQKENETNVRKMVDGWGGVDNIKPEDKLT